MPRIDTLLRESRPLLERGEPELLLAHVLGHDLTWLFTHGDDEADPAACAEFARLLQRRRDGEPVAYLTGRRGFWTLDLAVSPATLVPRAETERLVELALERAGTDRPIRVLDLGTGSGAVALAIAAERPLASIIATDASDAALSVARANASALGLERVEFRCGDWFDAVPGCLFDLVVSNPPYIAQNDPHLRKGDLRFEPHTALASGIDGLDAIRTISATAPAHIRPGGWLLVEHGWEQGAAVRGLLRAAGFVNASTVTDLEGRDRVSLAHMPG